MSLISRNFQTTLFGEEQLGVWLAFIGLFLMGVLLRYLISTSGRKQKQIPFRWDYFFYDNWRKLLITLILMFISIRFYVDISPWLNEQLPIKYTISEGFAIFLMGLLMQSGVVWLSKKFPKLKSGVAPDEYLRR